ncbi:MAG TPA: BamA/TamA family outer membrane protein [Kofleriaceae bacterium]|nr:BamA/TamA family outer membrane protein [Kofleriaceae bacterium]
MLLGRLALTASLVIAIAGSARAQTPTPVPADPQPRPVPVQPGSPPPSNEPTPYPAPVPADPAQPAPSQPAPAQPPPAQPAPDTPAQPAPPAQPAQPAQPVQPAQPTPPPPATPPAATPPVTVTPPAPMGVTTTKVTAYPQTPLVGTATIKSIVVEGNSKTVSDTVVLISKLSVGDSFGADMADSVKADLISSGLFKDVIVYWTNVEGGVQIHLVVQDKHSWVIAPAFYNQPTNIGGGIGFGENNLFGKNQKMLLYGQIATGDSFFIGAWVIPSLGGTRFYSQLDTYLKSARIIEYAAPSEYIDGATPKEVRKSRMNYLNGGVKLGIELFRGFKIDARLRAAKVSYKSVELADGATEAMVDPALAPGDPIPAPGGEGWDISNEWTATIDRRANYYGIQSGYRLGASFERALSGVSDFDYTLVGFSLYRAKQILARHNLVLRANLNIGRDVPFQQEYSLGGTTMRGYVNNQFRGDLKAIANVEYSVPLLTIKGFSVRGLAFFDSGYATFLRTREVEARRHYLPGADARGAAPFKNAVGVGTRLYLRQIVLPLLGLDFGYGLEARDYQIYLAIGLTD